MVKALQLKMLRLNREIIIFVIILLVIAGCGGGRKSGNENSDEFIKIDVTKKYPKRELILQDVFDVEYIALETTNEFACQGFVMAIGKKIIIVKNQVIDGNIYFFDRASGKGLKIINRFGRGGEEYLDIYGIYLDEDNDEMFVLDRMKRKIFVYDLDGKYKRSFSFLRENFYYGEIFNFDENHLICFIKDNWAWAIHMNRISIADYDKETFNKLLFLIISKQDGNVIKEIPFFFKDRKTMDIFGNGVEMGYSSPEYNKLIPYDDNWLLIDVSSDTIYQLLPDYSTSPVIVRTPSIHSMSPEVFLLPTFITNRYYFMKTIKKVARPGIEFFPHTYLVYDRQEQAIFESVVYNEDYSTEENFMFIIMATRLMNSEIIFYKKYEADDLFDAYRGGQLKEGKLKEIAAGLKEEDNPVIMLVKYKK